MQKFKPSYLIAALCVLVTVSCQKVATTNTRSAGSSRPAPGTKADSIGNHGGDTTTPVLPPFPQSAPLGGCSVDPIYGDTIIYPQPTGDGSDYIFYPVNSPGTGKYFAWPIGMVIDSLTGAINLTKSETGMQYAIGFVKDGTTDTCMQRLVVGGAAYLDSVYVIADGQTQAYPYFEANPYLPSICANNACSFDVDNFANSHGVYVDKTTGVIDLKKTLNGAILGLGGVFGLLPQNGNTVTMPISYRLNDPSNNALQHISVQLEYFDTRGAIGGGLLGGVLTKLDNVLTGNLISTYANPRPPLIIIVRR